MNKNYDPYKKTILFFFSLISVALMATVFAYFWYLVYWDTMYFFHFYRKGNWALIGLYAILVYFFSTMYGALRIGQLRRMEVVLSQFLATFLANIVMYFVVCLLAFGLVNPGYMILMQLIDCVIAVVWTVVTRRLYNRIFQPWKILLIYGDRPASELVDKLETRRDKYAIYGAIDAHAGIDRIAETVKDSQAVLIGDIAAETRNEILKYCYGNGIRAYVMPKISDIILMGGDEIHVFDTPFLLSKGYSLSFDQRFWKRTVDLLIAVPLTILLSPIMLLVAFAIKCCDGGPVFYRQVRCTKDNREFSILKFRSMIVDAEKSGEAVLAKEHDERITPVGRFLRAVRLDELPQLFNVLSGDMSLVGPRPERPEIIAEYQKEMPEFVFRTRVKAGVTGFAQIYGKYNTVPYDKLKLDLFYIENYSLWMDLKLILMTVKTVLKKDSTEGVDTDQTTGLKEHTEGNEEVERKIQEYTSREESHHE